MKPLAYANRWLSRLGDDGFALLLAGLGALGTGAVLVATSVWGAGAGSDESIFLSVAENLAEGRGFVSFYGSTTAHWPPLFPALLALGSLAGIEPLAAARFVNAAAFGATVFVFGRFLDSKCDSRMSVLAGTAAVLASPILTDMSSQALSDPLFLLFALLALVHIDRLQRGGGVRALVLSGVFSALCVSTRYMGVSVLATGAVVILLWAPGRPAARLGAVCAYLALSAPPLAAWLWRNLALTGTLTGPRFASAHSPFAILRMFADTMQLEILPFRAVLFRVSETAVRFGDAALLALAAGLGWVAAFRRRSIGRLLERLESASLVTVAMFFAAYSALLLFTGSTVELADPARERYVAPAQVCALFILVVLWDKAALRKRAKNVLAGCFAVFVAISAAMSADGLVRGWREGHSYTSRVWVESETMQWIEENIEGGRIYSNMPDAIYVRTGMRDGLRMLPPGGGAAPAPLPAAEPGVETWVAWFAGEKLRRLEWTMAQLRAVPGLEPAAELADGVVFRVVGERRDAGRAENPAPPPDIAETPPPR